jgi:type IV pilus assembly protein PilA
VDSIKTAVALCAQEAGGVLTDCNTGSNGVPTFTPTKEVATAPVAAGVITMTFAATGVGTGVDGTVVTITPAITPGATNVRWTVNADAVTNTAAKAALIKNN